MTSAIKRLCAAISVIALSGVAAAEPLPALTLDPLNGAVSGPAGSTVGWGFTLSNMGSAFAVVTGSDFCVGVPTSPCANSFGTYTDLAGPQFFVVGPSPEGSSFTQSFNSALQTGIGSFAINAGSSGTLLGTIRLSFDLFSVSPNDINFDPLLATISVGNFLTADASVTVRPNTDTPEPGALLLLGVGLAALGFLRRKVAPAA